MRKVLLLMAMLLPAVVMHAQPPVLLRATDTTILVEYEAGQFDRTRVVFTSLKDEGYAPSHNFGIDRSKGSFTDNWGSSCPDPRPFTDCIQPNGGDWDVRVEMYDTEKGPDVLAVSNVVRVRR